MRKLFGTDGIRGKADQFPLDSPTMFALGKSLAHRLGGTAKSPSVLLGMDTRDSGPRIAAAICAGVREGGGVYEFAGIIPTPAVAFLCRARGTAAGISISASHNPFDDNGIKIFGPDGMKLADVVELDIENEMIALRDTVEVRDYAPAETLAGLEALYVEFLEDGVEAHALDGCRLVVDPGNGAASAIVRRVFEAAGATVKTINDRPNGRNINLRSGALHPFEVAAAVVESGASFGFAFDGDADRVILVDDQGQVRNGDEILYLWARDLALRDRLENDILVATVMSNFGFERQLATDGIRLLRSAVGDKYVLEMMLREGAILGGEQSGHVIDLRRHSTGDGLHTALEVASIIAARGIPLSSISTFEPVPQVLMNHPVVSRQPLDEIPGFHNALEAAVTRLEGRGRVLVRYSGTEDLVRVMVEGDQPVEIAEIAEGLRQALSAILCP